jgi:hypothetical protein
LGLVNSGLSAGDYSIILADSWGCSASALITLTEPAPLTVSASSSGTVYYGYGPSSCADLSSIAGGGCPGYSYEWYNGGNLIGSGSSANVCPQQTMTYDVMATDQNGCTASASVEVCVVDVTCYAGNSGNQKVEMCHVPHGNPGNPQDICIDASAVPAHLAHGCTLGSCDEVNACSNVNARSIENSIESEIELMDNLTIYPNPVSDELFIEMEVQKAGEYTIELLNMDGKRLMSIERLRILEVGFHNWNLNLSELPAGVYILRIDRQNEGSSFKRVVKQ